MTAAQTTFGATLRRLANDLKREDATAERELRLEPGAFAALVAGEQLPDADLIERIHAVWPIEWAELCPPEPGASITIAIGIDHPDVDLKRGGRLYYRYRDTAIHRGAPFRPERIEIVQVAAPTVADHSDVEWNSGHLMSQFTYFVGDVDYHYRTAGGPEVIACRTGDSVWGAPYVPHSFTKRGEDPAFILALTYWSAFGPEAVRALGHVPSDRVAEMAAGEPGAMGALVRLYARARLLRAEGLAASAALPLERVAATLNGDEPAPADAVAMLRGLDVPEWVIAQHREPRPELVFQHSATAEVWAEDPGSGAAIRRLASSPIEPDLDAFEITLAPDPSAATTLGTHQFQFAYVVRGDIRLTVDTSGGSRDEALTAGDSFCADPLIGLEIACAGAGDAVVIVLRVAGPLGPGLRTALAQLTPDDRRRVTSDLFRWF